MEIIFIGTSSGRTSLNRFHSSLLFKVNSKNILIDVGDGISKALLTQKISFNSITDIIISHYHSDHIAGLPSLLTQMVISGRSEQLKIYTNADLVKPLGNLLIDNFIFVETFKFDIEIIGFDSERIVELSDSFNFLAKQNLHIINKHNLKINNLTFISSSFLFSIGSERVVYTSDIGHPEDLYLFQDINPDIFITETTHISLPDIEKAVNLMTPQKVYLTHIDDEEELKKWFAQLPIDQKNQFFIAEDGIKINLV